jgi:hypothetical protein
MSRWSELFEKLSRGVTDGDRPRHTDDAPTAVCHGVSPSVNGGLAENPPPTEFKAFHPAVGWLHNSGNSANITFCDFETVNRSGCDLTKVGAWRYAADPATEVLCFGYRVDYDDLCWIPNAGFSDCQLISFAANPARRFACFAGFEPIVWQLIMVERHGFPPIPTERWIDVRAACSYLALPRKLEKVLPVLGLSVTKDVAGQRFIRGLSRPNRQGVYPALTEAVLRRVVEYNRSDLRALEALYEALAGDLDDPTS